MTGNRTRAELDLSTIPSLIFWTQSERQMSLVPPTLARTSPFRSRLECISFYHPRSNQATYKMGPRMEVSETTLSQSSKLLSYCRALECPTPNFHFLCNGSTEPVTVMNKAGAFFKLSVPRSLTLKNIAFDSADSHAESA